MYFLFFFLPRNIRGKIGHATPIKLTYQRSANGRWTTVHTPPWTKNCTRTSTPLLAIAMPKCQVTDCMWVLLPRACVRAVQSRKPWLESTTGLKRVSYGECGHLAVCISRVIQRIIHVQSTSISSDISSRQATQPSKD